MFPMTHVSQAIRLSPALTYAFISDPRNLPRWAAGLVESELEEEAGEWTAQSPMGRVRIRFCPDNPYGVLDHDVELESGEVFPNAMRVIPNGEGCEVIFSVLRKEGMTDEEFLADQEAIRKDLAALKDVLEKGP